MNRAVAALALLMTLPVPLAGAQGEATALLDDDANDLSATVGGNPAAPPSGRFMAADLRALTVTETKEEFLFTIAVESLDPENELPFLENTDYTLDFVNGGKAYRIAVQRFFFMDASYFAQLEGYDAGRDEYFYVAFADVTADPAEDTLTVEVARRDLADENGAAPFPGQPFRSFVARTRTEGFLFGGGGFSIAGQPVEGLVASDQMPDDGPDGTVLPILFGAAQSGNARLASEVPFRASNGEETTFVYEVDATNLGEEDDRFTLDLSGVPEGWDVRLPGNSLRLEGNGTATIPVVAAIPFAHNHGSVASFVLEMRSQSDPGSVGRVELGVRYTDPPQPAGHHDTVHLHSSQFDFDDPLNEAFCSLGTCAFPYFNTLAQDDLDDEVPIAGRQVNFGFDGGFDPGDVPQSTFYWDVPLSPGLELGLDFDMGREGTATIPFHAGVPIVGGSLEGQLVHWGEPQEGFGVPGIFGEGRTVVARLSRVDLDVGANSDFQYEATIAATEAGDYVPFELGAGLSLELFLNMTNPQVFNGVGENALNPLLLAGGEMRLPLLEYQDPVNTTFSSLSSLLLVAESGQERQVNPGETVLFNFTVVNDGLVDQGLHLNVTGSNAGWARIVGDDGIVLAAGAERPVVVAVEAPKGAADGDVADLVLNVVNASDPTVRALGRLVAQVNATAELADEAHLLKGLEEELSSSKGAPGPGLALMLAALGLAMLARRRL